MPTLWVLALFGIFYRFCFHVQTCRHLGGGGGYTDNMFEIFVRFGRCLCCSLPLFVNRQLPCLHTNSLHGLLLPQMHHKSLWFAKGHALGVKPGGR